jgi:hypothetical protein
MHVALSWDGERAVIWEQNTFRFGPVASELSAPVVIPILNPRLSAEPERLEELAHVFFWVSEHQLVLSQLDRQGDSEPLCGLFDTQARQWEPLPECPSGDFRETVQIDPGPDGWIAVYSAAEGTETLLLAKYDPQRGKRETRAPRVNLDPMGAVQARFSLDGERIDFATTCLLQREEWPCREQEEHETWRLYSWLIQEERLVLRREGLPAGFVPAPDGARLAWPSPGAICVGEWAHLEGKRCFCLPGAKPDQCRPE